MVLFLPALSLSSVRVSRYLGYRRTHTCRRGHVLLIALLASLSAWTQTTENVNIVPRERPQRAERDSVPGSQVRLRVDVEMVLVPVTVTDTKNHPVVDLERHNFKLFEGNNEETIQYFGTEDAPIS